MSQDSVCKWFPKKMFGHHWNFETCLNLSHRFFSQFWVRFQRWRRTHWGRTWTFTRETPKSRNESWLVLCSKNCHLQRSYPSSRVPIILLGFIPPSSSERILKHKPWYRIWANHWNCPKPGCFWALSEDSVAFPTNNLGWPQRFGRYNLLRCDDKAVFGRMRKKKSSLPIREFVWILTPCCFHCWGICTSSSNTWDLRKRFPNRLRQAVVAVLTSQKRNGTPPKFNMEPENESLEEGVALQNHKHIRHSSFVVWFCQWHWWMGRTDGWAAMTQNNSRQGFNEHKGANVVRPRKKNSKLQKEKNGKNAKQHTLPGRNIYTVPLKFYFSGPLIESYPISYVDHMKNHSNGP